MNTQEHAGVLLGQWVRGKRKESKLVASRVAGEINLSPSKYAELELGVGKWVTAAMKKSLFFALRLNSADSQKLSQLIDAAIAEPRTLSLSNVFTREQLKPMRLRCETDQVTLEDSEMILDQVFAPLT